jgi:glycogen debranching enzyme GlgX
VPPPLDPADPDSDAPPVWPGHHQIRGASYDGAGTNVAVWAPDATSVYVCLFDAAGHETRARLPEFTLGMWHGYLPGIGPGQHYGLRAEGPWDPAHGLRFDVEHLLADPYGRSLDSSSRSVVVADDFDWGDDARPQTPWRRTVVYEAHVKGLTRTAEELPPELRGTYAGLGHPATTSYLTGLGVTAVELMPIHAFVSEPALRDRGLVNFWGYNSLGYFAPHPGYSSAGGGGAEVREFRQMVKDLHSAGLEVILDVVYNHTAEGGCDGPTLSFRGLADGRYYLHDEAGDYRDVTGCGNTVQVSERQVLQLVMDSLRYWVSQMHVDGFRFDLAPALCRALDGAVDLNAAFLTAIHQDPVLRDVKLIAEPWDATADGYLVGRFPPPWCEWNDKFRDGVRDFWRGRADGVRDLAYRISGSSDLYADDDRLPFASINLVTAHDGFTLRDLVSYQAKHNEANGDDNRDGTDDNRSWNCGVEGETTDPAVIALRRRQAANLLATLLLSTGVPMLTAGDERGRTQGGTNNAYCHDDATSWVDWQPDATWGFLLPLVRDLLRLRADHPVLRQRYFFEGRPLAEGGRKDISWLQPDGTEMTLDAWQDTGRRTLGVFLAGDALRARTVDGRSMTDCSYLLWFHAGDEPVTVTLPAEIGGYRAVLRTDRLDTPADDASPETARLPGGSVVELADHTVAVYEAT